MMDDMVEPGGTPTSRRQHVLIKALGKNMSLAEDGITMKSPRHDHKPNWPASHRQVCQAPIIAAVDPFRDPSTPRTGTSPARRVDGDYHTCVTATDAVDHESARDQCQGSKRSLHDGDSPLLKPPQA
jgi:hypothetical protein